MDKSETIIKLRELNNSKFEAKKKYDETCIALGTELRSRIDNENNGFAVVKRNHESVISDINDDITTRRRINKQEYSEELHRIDEEMTQIRIAYFREHPDDNLM